MDMGQASSAADWFMTKCREDGGTLAHPDVQVVLEEEGDALVEEMFNCLRSRVERRAKMISRRARVDYTRTERQALDAMGRIVCYLDDKVLERAPKTGHGVVEVEGWFFDLDYDPTPTELAREYGLRNLVPDFYWQCAVNGADKAERPNSCQWDLSENGSASYASFDRYGDLREVYVYQCAYQRRRRYRFGGVRK